MLCTRSAYIQRKVEEYENSLNDLLVVEDSLKFFEQASCVSREWDIKLLLYFRQPHSGTSSSISYSPILSPITSSSSDSPLCTSITPFLFHSRFKIYRFHKSYPHSFTSSSRTASNYYCLDRFFWATWFLFYFFPYFFASVPCAPARLSWPSRQLFSAR